jgi:cofilin
MDQMGGLYIPLDCRDQFYYLRMKRQWRYIIFKVSDEDPTFVEIERCGPRDQTFDEFKENMPKDQARWVVYDFEFTVKEYGLDLTKAKIIFMVYNPDINTNSLLKSIIVFKK